MRTPADVLHLTRADIGTHAFELASVLLDAVADGASLGFMEGETLRTVMDYWLDAAARGDRRVVLAVRDGEGIAGCVMLVPAAGAFQPHRADIFKLAVHRRARGQGLAALLMRAAEEQALKMDRWMLSLMTRRGCDAEHLYRKLGWSLAGTLPDDSLTPQGQLCDATVYVKRLR